MAAWLDRAPGSDSRGSLVQPARDGKLRRGQMPRATTFGGRCRRHRARALALARQVDGRRAAAATRLDGRGARRRPRARGAARAQGPGRAAHRPRGAAAAGLARALPVAADAALRPTTRRAPTVTAPDGARFGWGDPRLADALADDLGPPVRLRRDLGGHPGPAQQRARDLRGEPRARSEAELGAEIDLRRFRHQPPPRRSTRRPGRRPTGRAARCASPAGCVLRLLHPCVRCAIPTRDPGHAGEVGRPAAPPRRPPRHAASASTPASVARPRERRRGRARPRRSA